MPKLFLLSNTLFGNKAHLGFNRHLEESEKYFFNEVIPFLKKYAKPNDSLIHLGGVFSSKQTLNVKTIDIAQKILSNIANILPVYLVVGDQDKYAVNSNLNTLLVFKNIQNIRIINQSELLYGGEVLVAASAKNVSQLVSNSRASLLLLSGNPDDKIDLKSEFCRFKGVYSGHSVENYTDGNYINVGSPYQTEPNTKQKGIYVVDVETNNYKFLPNASSTVFKTIELSTPDDVNQLTADVFTNAYVDVIISKTLYYSGDTKIKLSKFDIQSITCTDDITMPLERADISDIFNIDEKIDELILQNPDIVEDFQRIKSIYESN